MDSSRSAYGAPGERKTPPGSARSGLSVALVGEQLAHVRQHDRLWRGRLEVGEFGERRAPRVLWQSRDEAGRRRPLDQTSRGKLVVVRHLRLGAQLEQRRAVDHLAPRAGAV